MIIEVAGAGCSKVSLRSRNKCNIQRVTVFLIPFHAGSIGAELREKNVFYRSYRFYSFFLFFFYPLLFSLPLSWQTKICGFFRPVRAWNSTEPLCAKCQGAWFCCARVSAADSYFLPLLLVFPRPSRFLCGCCFIFYGLRKAGDAGPKCAESSEFLARLGIRFFTLFLFLRVLTSLLR